MKKFFIISAFILLAAVAASAQTANQQKDNAGQVAPIAKLLGVVREKQPTLRVTDGRVVRLGPTTTYLKKGLSKDEVVKLLGKPESVNEREDGAVLRSTYIFERSEGRRLVAEFENGLLVRSNMEAVGDEDASQK